MKQIVMVVTLLLWLALPQVAASEAPPSGGMNPERPATGQGEDAAILRFRATLQIAWWHYREGRFDKAMALFDEVMRGMAPLSLRQEAQWGKALCLDRLKRRDEAAALIEDLRRQGMRTVEVERWLYGYRKGREIGRKGFWEERIREEARSCIRTGNPDSILLFLSRNRKALDRCVAPEAFFEVAKALRLTGRSEEAKSLGERLLECLPRQYDIRLGIYAELMEVLSPDKMLELLGYERKRPDLPESYQKQLNRLETEALKRKLFALPENDPATETLTGRILEKDPNDPDALLKLGWYLYRRGQFGDAERVFIRLRSVHPERPEALLGLSHTLISQKRFGEALEVLQGVRPPYPEGYRAALVRLHREEGAYWWKAKDLTKAEASLRQAVAVNPDDVVPWRLLGWVLLERGSATEAVGAFEKALELKPDAESYQGLLLSLEKAGRLSEAYRRARDLARSEDPSLRKVAADHFLRSGKVLLYASSLPEAGKETGAWATVRGSYESRSGDEGTSRLQAVKLPMSFYLPWGTASLWIIEVEGIRLDAGDLGPNPFVGSIGLPESRFYDDSRWVTSRWVMSPSVTMIREGMWDVRGRLGLSPLGGPLDPVPVFSLELSNPRWRLELHQKSVEDSLLSWIGQRDPYSERTWGRVLRTGGSAAWNFSWNNGIWASLSFGADYYWGDDVWRNFSLLANVALGKSFSWEAGTFSVGAFLTATHYDRNSDFYTLGHGGYFSPSVFLMTGPTFRFRTEPGKDWWVDAEASAGYLYYETDSSPLYPEYGSLDRYDGEHFSGAGYSGGLRAVRLITSHLALGMNAEVNKSSAYTRWSVGAGLTWFIDAQTVLGQRAPHYDALFNPTRW